MSFDIDLFAIPAQQDLHREAVAKIMEPGSVAIRRPAQTDLVRQLDEGAS